MRRAYLAWGAITGLIASSASAAPLKELKPVTAWRVDYGNERCSLAQQYSNGTDSILLEIDSYGSREAFFVTLSGSAISRGMEAVGQVSYRFPGDAAGREARLYRGTLPATNTPSASFPIRFETYDEYKTRHDTKDKDGLRRLRLRPERAVPGYEHTINAVVVGLSGAGTIQLDVHDLAAPLAALRTCVDNLDTTWGIDPDVQKHLSRQPDLDENDTARLAAAYPTQMLRNGLSALVPVRFMVDAAGKVTSCVLQGPIAEPKLKSAICSNLVHFTPALDAAGNPVASVHVDSVSFITPN